MGGVGLHVSVSQVKCYLRCPRQYQLKYVIGEAPAFTPVALVLGTTFHHALARYYQGVADTFEHPPLEMVIQAFRDAWARAQESGVPLQVDEEHADLAGVVDKGVQMVAAFHKHATAAPPVDVQRIEMPFEVEIHDPITGEVLDETLVGAFDLVAGNDNGRVIYEHKSAARRWAEDQIRHDPQPTAYKMAARQMGMEAAVRLQVVTKAKEPVVQVAEAERTEADEDEFLALVVGVLRAVDVGAFYPLRGPGCRTCPFSDACCKGRPGARRSSVDGVPRQDL